MPTKYYVIDDKELTASQLVDKMGKLHAELERGVKEFKKMRKKLLKDFKRPGKVMGNKFVGTIEIYDKKQLDQAKLKKHVEPKVLKKCYTVVEDCKRLKLKAKPN